MFFSIFALISTSVFGIYDHDHSNCNHDHLDHPEPLLNYGIKEDFPPSREKGRILAAYPNFRTFPYYNRLDSAPPSYRRYMQYELVPAVLSYFEGALRVKYPVVGKLTIDDSIEELCGIPVPSILRDGGVDADFFFMIDSTVDPGTSWVAESYSCQQAAGTKRPIVAKTLLNRDMIKNPGANILLHEKNIYLLLHEITHTLGFSSNLYKYFLDDNGEFLTGHIKTGVLDGKTATVVDVPVLTNKIKSHFGCSSIKGAFMENTGTAATAGSHFERRQFGFEAMTSGLVYQQSYSELTLAMLEATGWYEPNYEYADSFLWGKGQGCSFLTKSCQSPGFNFEEFCSGGGKGCTVPGRGGGYCQDDVRSDGCKFYHPREEMDCENPDSISSARLPELQSFGREANSKCFSGDLTSDFSASPTTFCFKYKCQGSGENTILEIQMSQQSLICTEEGPLEVAGYNGSINCPDPLTFCRTVGRKTCPRGCMGRGTCVHGTCVCKRGFTGKDCASI